MTIEFSLYGPSTKAQEKALLHKVRAQPYYQSIENEILWKYEVECKGKMQLGHRVKTRSKFVKLATKSAGALAGSRNYYTPVHTCDRCML
jgi:hypothetical protein